MSLPRFDLHIHTDRSDGSTPPEQVVLLAHRRGLAGIAVCDHDTMTAVEPARQAAASLGLEVICGVELSTRDAQTGRNVHLLVYFPQDAAPLLPIFEAMRVKRLAVGEEMLRRLSARFDIDPERVRLHAAPSGTLYRVHLMRALMEAGYAPEAYGALYRELFAHPGGSCLVPVEYTDMMAAARAARASGGAVVLAHPGIYDSYDAAGRLAAAGLLDGLEYDYPRRKTEQTARHDDLAERWGLLRTAGTDFHGFYSPTPHPPGTCAADEYTVSKLRKLAQRQKKPDTPQEGK